MKQPRPQYAFFGSATFQIISICTGFYIAIRFFGDSVTFLGVPWYKTLELLHEHPRVFFGVPWITSIFIHKDIAHLFGNQFILYLCSVPLEIRFGPRFVWGLFMLGGVFGNLVFLHFMPFGVISYGASAGVSAVLTSFLLYFPRLTFFPEKSQYDQMIQLKEGIPSYWLLSYYLFNNILGTIFGVSSGIGFVAHLGGIVIGFFSWALSTSSDQWGEWHSIFPLPKLIADELKRWTTPLILKAFSGLGIFIFICGFLTNRGVIPATFLVPFLRAPSQESHGQESHDTDFLRQIFYRNSESELKKLATTLLYPLEVSPDFPWREELGECPTVDRIAEVLGVSRTSLEMQNFSRIYHQQFLELKHRIPLSPGCLQNETWE